MIFLQENLSKLFGGVVQFLPGTLQQGGGAGWGLFSEYNYLFDYYTMFY